MGGVITSLSMLMLFFGLNASAMPDGGDDDDDDGGGNWSTKANTIHHNYSFGTKNAFPILFKTNNIQRMVLTSNGFFGINVLTPLAPLHTNGDVIFNTLIGTGIGLVYTGDDGKISRYSFTGNNRHVLLGDGTFGEYSDNDWTVDGNNIYNQNTGNVGINTQTPEYQLDVNGDAKVRGEFSVGNSIKFNGITDQITTTTGNLDFGTTNLSTDGTIKTNSIISNSGTLNLGSTNITTTGNISGGSVTFSGSSVFDDITVNNETTTGILNSNKINLKNILRFTDASSAIVSAGDLNVESQANVNISSVNNIVLASNQNTLIRSKLGIGTDSPIEMLDVAGNANIQGYLYVQDGVIIGRRISGEKVSADTIDIAKKLTAKEIEASEKIRNSNITIDGQNSTISSQSGQIGFANTNLENINKIFTNGAITSNEIITTKITSPNNTVDFADNILGHVNLLSAQKIETGDISASTINITGATSFENLTVNNGINLGKELIFTGSESRINSSYNLLLQNEATSGNTVMNLNAGKVGIGIENPIEMLDVNGNANIRGYLYVQDGVIIGQRMESEVMEAAERIASKRITAERMTVDTLEISQDLKSRRLEATESIHSNNINIDGINSTISSTTGVINFDDENLLTTGTVNAGTISATTITTDDLTIINPVSLAELTITDKLEVTNSIKVGNNSLWLSSTETVPGSNENKIFTDDGDLKIQCEAIPNNNNTIINAGNNGKVGIGTLTPGFGYDNEGYGFCKLDVGGQARFFGADQNKFIRIGYNGQNSIIDGVDDINGALLINWYSGRNTIIGSDGTHGAGSLTANNEVSLATTSGHVTIGSVNNTANLEVKGEIKLNNKNLYLKSGDTNHGLGYYGSTALTGTLKFANTDIDGPVLYGWSGGALGSRYDISGATQEKVALQWSQDGKVGIGNPTTIDAKLHVAGDVVIDDLAGNGSQMVVVDDNGKLGKKDMPFSQLHQDGMINVFGNMSEATTISGNQIVLASNVSAQGQIQIPISSPTSNITGITLNTESSNVFTYNSLLLKQYGFGFHSPSVTTLKGTYISGKEGIDLFTDNSLRLSIKQNGKVGIGTDDPKERLQLGDLFTFHTGGTKMIGRNVYWYSDGTTNYSRKITDVAPDPLDPNITAASSALKFNADGSINFSVDNNTPDPANSFKINWINPLKIAKNGDIELGDANITSYPSTLTVNSSLNFKTLPDKNSDATALMLVKGSDGIIGTKDVPGLCSAITCDGNNVGIGTPNPLADLHIYGSNAKIRLQNLQGANDPVVSNWDIENTGSFLNFKFNDQIFMYISPGEAMDAGVLIPKPILRIYGTILSDCQNNLKWTDNNWNTSLMFPTNSVIRTNTKGTYLNRYLGFGMNDNVSEGGWYWISSTSEDNITTPIYHMKLNVLNDANKTAILAVEGNIWAKEIKVKATNPYTADFVFDKDYKLPTLNEVEQFVTENKHLKDVPSAKEIETEGTDLQKMTGILLQKIEELTLYTIQQQKKIDNLECEMETLKSK